MSKAWGDYTSEDDELLYSQEFKLMEELEEAPTNTQCFRRKTKVALPPVSCSSGTGAKSSQPPLLRVGSASSSNPLHDSRLALSTFDTSADDLTMVDAATLRRKVIKLNRRLQLLEEENKERVKREMILHSITVAFWLVNTWVWLRR